MWLCHRPATRLTATQRPSVSPITAWVWSHENLHRGGVGQGLHSSIYFTCISRILLREEKDGGLRPCIDYRGLNDISVKFCYPLPLVPASLEQLRKAKYFTKLDLRSAYNLIRIREGDEWKTAFSTTSGHYEYLVMPFGLSNSPSVFQAFINKVFRDMLNRWVIVYIDDILIYSDSYEDHVQHVRVVLQRLIANQLYAKTEKCEFHQSTVSFLGYVISSGGVAMDERKVRAVVNWPRPHSVKELQRFLGFANFYRRFIRNFSTVEAPLTSMSKKGPQHLVWTPRATSAFQELRKRFTTAPILHHPDPELEFIVEVDASSTGLEQFSPNDRETLSKHTPVLSTPVNSTRLNRTTMWATENFSPWKQLSRNGVTGLRELNTPSPFWPITVTLNIWDPRFQGFFICHMINYTGYNQKWNVGQIRSAQWTVQRIKKKIKIKKLYKSNTTQEHIYIYIYIGKK